MSEPAPFTAEETARLEELTQQFKDTKNTALLEEAFKIIDRSGDGNLDIDEFKLLMGSSVSGEEAERLFAEADVDGDSSISLPEYIEMMTKRA